MDTIRREPIFGLVLRRDRGDLSRSQQHLRARRVRRLEDGLRRSEGDHGEAGDGGLTDPPAGHERAVLRIEVAYHGAAVGEHLNARMPPRDPGLVELNLQPRERTHHVLARCEVEAPHGGAVRREDLEEESGRTLLRAAHPLRPRCRSQSSISFRESVSWTAARPSRACRASREARPRSPPPFHSAWARKNRAWLRNNGLPAWLSNRVKARSPGAMPSRARPSRVRAREIPERP